MYNPIPKNKMFATLNANQVAGIIAGLPEEYRSSAYQVYFGTVNMLSECVDAAIEVYNHKDAKEYPVVTDWDHYGFTIVCFFTCNRLTLQL